MCSLLGDVEIILILKQKKRADKRRRSQFMKIAQGIGEKAGHGSANPSLTAYLRTATKHMNSPIRLFLLQYHIESPQCM